MVDKIIGVVFGEEHSFEGSHCLLFLLPVFVLHIVRRVESPYPLAACPEDN